MRWPDICHRWSRLRLRRRLCRRVRLHRSRSRHSGGVRDGMRRPADALRSSAEVPPIEIEHARPDRGQCGTPWHRTPPGKDAASRPGRRNWSASGDARVANPLDRTPSAGHGLLQLPVGHPTRVEREGAYSSRAPSPTRLCRAIEDWRDVVPQPPHSPTGGSSPPPSRSDSARQNPRSVRGPLAAPERE